MDNQPAEELSDEQLAWIEQIGTKVLSGESTLQIEKGITPEQMEIIYFHAYTLFQSGKYEDAKALFQFLGLHDPIEPKYFLGVAGCLEETHEYKAAAQFYLQALVLSDQDPQPGYRAALCLRAIGDLEAAEGALHLAIEHTIDSEANAPLKEMAAELRDELEKANSEQGNN